jgi:hypothetical protein
MYWAQNIVKMKSYRNGYVGHLVHMEKMRNECKSLVGNLTEKGNGRPKRKWEGKRVFRYELKSFG